MNYLKLTAANKCSTDLLKVYLVTFENYLLEYVQVLTRTDLIRLVESAETKRRPGRAFCIVLGIDQDSHNWYLFAQKNIDNGSPISAAAVETPKLFNRSKCLPYRTLYSSPNFLEQFFTSDDLNSESFLKRVLDLRFFDQSLSLYIPLLFFKELYVTIQHNLITKTLRNPSINIITSAMSVTTAEITVPSTTQSQPIQTTSSTSSVSTVASGLNTTVQMSTLPSSSANQIGLLQAPPGLTAPLNSATPDPNQIVYPQNFGAPGWFGAYSVKLDNVFNPDDPNSKNNVEDCVHLLEFCNNSNQYRNQETLIMAFLGSNSMINRIGNLSHAQLTDLNVFCEWLRTFCRHDVTHFKNLFNSCRQGSASAMSYFLNLENYYRKSHSMTKAVPLSHVAKKTIIKQYIKGLNNEKVKQALAVIPEHNVTYDGPTGIVSQTEYFGQQLRDLYPDPPSHIAQAAVVENFNPQLQILTETIKKIGKELEEVKFNLTKQKEPYCSKCKDRNHNTNDCRASPKFKRQGNQRFNNSINANASRNNNFNHQPSNFNNFNQQPPNFNNFNQQPQHFNNFKNQPNYSAPPWNQNQSANYNWNSNSPNQNNWVPSSDNWNNANYGPNRNLRPPVPLQRNVNFAPQNRNAPFLRNNNNSNSSNMPHNGNHNAQFMSEFYPN